MSYPSHALCRELAGAAPGGSVADLADLIAQAIENDESAPADRAPNPPTLAAARKAVARIRQILDKVDLRLEVLQ